MRLCPLHARLRWFRPFPGLLEPGLVLARRLIHSSRRACHVVRRFLLVLHTDYIMYITYVRPVGYRSSTSEHQISADLVFPLDIRLIRLNSNPVH